MRLILDGTVVRVRPDRKATTISLLVVLGVRRDGRKILPAVGNIGGASEAARRAVLDDPVARGRRTPEFLIIDGAAGLDKALAALRPMVPTQRNLLAHAPDRLHAAVSADRTGMIYAGTAAEVGERRKAFIRKRRLKGRAVADSVEEAGEQLCRVARRQASRWKSARTTNAVARLREECERRLRAQTVPPSPETAALPFWARRASGQITTRRIDGRPTLAERPTGAVIDPAA